MKIGSLVAFGVMLGWFVTACAGSRGPGASDATDSPAAERAGAEGVDIEALLGREASGLKETESSGQGPKASPLAAGSVQAEKIDGATQYAIPIGTESPVSCVLFDEDQDAGARLAALLEGAKQKVTLEQVTLQPAVVIQEAPLVGLQAFYSIPTENGKGAGLLKALYHMRFGATGFCIHDEVGYSETFRKVASSFFDSLRVELQDSSTFHEVHFGEVNGVPAGFDISRVIPRDNGESTHVSLSLLMIQRSPKDIHFSDSATVLSLDKSGKVREGRWFESESGRPTLDMTLKREKGSKYVYSGELHGKKIEGTVQTKAKDGWSGPKLEAAELNRRVKAGKPFEWSSESYVPDRDPTRFETRLFSRTKEDPPNTVHMKADQVHMTGIVDDHGLMERGEATVGPVNIVLKRALKRGSL